MFGDPAPNVAKNCYSDAAPPATDDRLRGGERYLPGVDGAAQRVYAFTSYPEFVARFRSGLADSAIDQIKRTYGAMYTSDPGITAWEGIGPGGTPYEGAFTSMAHGWSTGALPALTNELLGVSRRSRRHRPRNPHDHGPLTRTS